MLIRVLIAIVLWWSCCFTRVEAAYDKMVNDVFGSLQESPKSVDSVDIFYFDKAAPNTKTLAKYMYEMEPLLIKKLNVFDAKGDFGQLLVALEKAAPTDTILVVQIKTTEQGDQVLSIAKRYQRPLILLQSELGGKLLQSYDQAYFLGMAPEDLGAAQANLLINYFKKFRTDFNRDGMINLVMITGKYKDPISFGIAHGCLETLKSHNVSYRVVSLSQTDGTTKEAFAAMNQAIDKNDLTNIDVVICNNDTIAMAVVDSMQRFGFNGYGSTRLIPVVGVGNTSAVKKYMEYGNVLGTVGVDALQLAQAIVSLANNLQNGGKPEKVSHAKVEGQQVKVKVTQYLANTKYHPLNTVDKQSELANAEVQSQAFLQAQRRYQAAAKLWSQAQRKYQSFKYRSGHSPQYQPLYQRKPQLLQVPQTWQPSLMQDQYKLPQRYQMSQYRQSQQQLRYQPPQYQVPEYKVPEYQVPEYKIPQYQKPEYSQPDYEPLKYVHPQYQMPQYRQPEYQIPEYERPKYELPQYQQPQYQ